AENLILRQQTIVSARKLKKSPPLTTFDRVVFALGTLLIRPHRLPRLGIIVAHSTLLKFHRAMVKRKYRLLFDGTKSRKKPGSKGPSLELIEFIVGIKARNPMF